MPNILFDPTIEGLARTLTLHQQRHEVLASNLANVETPGYRARELDFQDVLKEAFEETTGGGWRARRRARFDGTRFDGRRGQDGAPPRRREHGGHGHADGEAQRQRHQLPCPGTHPRAPRRAPAPGNRRDTLMDLTDRKSTRLNS